MVSNKQQITHQELVHAEKLVVAGIIKRILPGLKTSCGVEKAPAIINEVIGRIFSLALNDSSNAGSDAEYFEKAIEAIKADGEMRLIITEAMVMRVVHGIKQTGCSSEDRFKPVDRLKELGIYLEGDSIPVASSFIEHAKRFSGAV